MNNSISKNNDMKIAIFHDYFGSIGGGEKLVIELAKGLHADIITTEVNEKNMQKIFPKEQRKNIKIINLGPVIQFPIIKQIHSSILFSRADFTNEGYEKYLMSGNWAVFACKKHHPNTYYIHTPVRMFYDGKKFFYSLAPWWAKIPFLLWIKIHGYFVQKYFRHAEKLIANSTNVQKRIKKYHHRNSTIINPPIKKYPLIKYGDFWLSVTRFYPHKRIELLFEVFKKMPEEKLMLIGGCMKGDHSKDYMNRIIHDKPDNVIIIGEVNEKILSKYYGECKAFITLSKDEDFGMTVLEANSAGKMVVATNEGGHKETVINEKTGYLAAPHAEDIISKIKKVSKNPEIGKNACIKNSRRYTPSEFIKKISRIMVKHTS